MRQRRALGHGGWYLSASIPTGADIVVGSLAAERAGDTRRDTSVIPNASPHAPRSCWQSAHRTRCKSTDTDRTVTRTDKVEGLVACDRPWRFEPQAAEIEDTRRMPSAPVAKRRAAFARSAAWSRRRWLSPASARRLPRSVQAHRRRISAASLVLRLPDVGNGYRIDSDSGCGRLGVENAPPQVRQLILTYWPTGCEMIFGRWWLDPGGPAKGAREIQSGAYVFPSVASATEAMSVAADFARYVLGDYGGFTPRAEPFVLADETKLFAAGRDFTVAWRRGGVLALLHVDGRTSALARQTALSLARVQHKRELSAPRRCRPEQTTIARLHSRSPRLGVPVNWLGRRFDPGPALPTLRLENAEGNYGPEECLWMGSFDRVLKGGTRTSCSSCGSGSAGRASSGPSSAERTRGTHRALRQASRIAATRAG